MTAWNAPVTRDLSWCRRARADRRRPGGHRLCLRAGGLFPALDANLTLTQAGEQASLLGLAGAYRLPAAAYGMAIADLAAAAMIRAFLTRVAVRIACLPAHVA